MARYTVTIHRDGARLRPNHDTNNTAHGTIPGGTVLPCDEVFTATTATTYQAVGDRWAKVSYAFNGITYVGWAAIIHLGNPICAIEENTTTPPATDEIFVSVEADITATVNGKQYHGAVMFDNVQLRLVE